MEYTSIYGYIKIEDQHEAAATFLKTLGKDETYPFINTNMFSFGDYEIPFYYEDMIFGFAATYKYFGLDLRDWNAFVLKMENILRNIAFSSAQFHVESALGNYTLFWTMEKPLQSGEENDVNYQREYRLTKTGEWYFGFGRRSPFTGYPLSDEDNPLEDLRKNKALGFVYPVPKN